MKIIISPYSQRLKDNRRNAKNYPYWNKIIDAFKDTDTIIQIGLSYEEKLNNVHEFKKDLDFDELENLVKLSDFWMSVDNFFPHFCNTIDSSGLVIFSKSDPMIYGYSRNINILKDRKYLRHDQFGLWDECAYDEESFIEPSIIIEIVNRIKNDKITLSKVTV